MRIFALLISIIFILTAQSANAEVAINTRITIKPGNPDEAADKLVQQAQRLKGYFVTRSGERVELKIPNPSADAMQQFIEKNWLVYQQDYHANDISVRLMKTKANLNAKESLLGEYQKILATARSDKLVKVSAAVTSLVQEIELLRGQINLMQHQVRFAKITVVFQLDRNTVEERQMVSSFPWLNSVGLSNLLADFQ